MGSKLLDQAVGILTYSPETRPVGNTNSFVMSDRESKFPGGLFLRGVHCYEAVDLLGRMKPLGCSKMGEIERTWSGHGGQHNGFAEIQSEIAQKEERPFRAFLA